MSGRRVMILALGVIFGAFVALIILSAVPAKAFPGSDRQFLDDVHAADIVSSAGDSDLIKQGHQVCHYLTTNSEASIVATIMYNADGLSKSKAQAFVDAAELWYCPSYASSSSPAGPSQVGGAIGGPYAT